MNVHDPTKEVWYTLKSLTMGCIVRNVFNIMVSYISSCHGTGFLSPLGDCMTVTVGQTGKQWLLGFRDVASLLAVAE